MTATSRKSGPASDQPLVVLAVGAHPDDVEINCAGTLKALQEVRAAAIHVATMTLGDCGSKELPPDEISRIRRAEAEDSCRILGAQYHHLGSRDFCVFNDDDHNRRTTALLREVAPQILFTHSPADYLLDHDTTSVLVRNACFYASVPNYDCSRFGGAPALSAIPHLYYWDVMEGTDIFGRRVAPGFYVDISAEMELKWRMLAAHRSQREWLRAQHHMDEYLDSMRDWAAARGREASGIAVPPESQGGEGGFRARTIAYAEALRQHLGHAYPRDNVLAALLPSRVVLNPHY
jgi:LmbE family N-acetylglucosaminyl deacetylase